MKVINKDLTHEKMWVNVSNTQFYAEIFSKVHGKWKVETYFEDFGFEVDKELMNLTIKNIINLWKLKNPKLYIAFGN